MSVGALPTTTTTATQAPSVAAQAQPRPKTKWIAGPWFDGMFFLFPVLFSVIYVGAYLLYQNNLAVVGFLNTTLFAFGVFHTCGTFFFYFDKTNLAFYKKHYWRYFLFPALIWGGTVALSVSEWYLATYKGLPFLNITILILYIWGNYHVTRQNVGFIAFYRTKSGNYDPKERNVDNWMIYSNALLLYWMGWCYMDKPYFLAEFNHPAVHLFITLPLALFLVYRLWVGLRSRIRSLRASRGSSWPHIAMILTALIFPFPLFFTVFNPEPNFLMFSHSQFGLVAHYTQYVAIVALLHFHKYPGMLPSAHGHDGEGAEKSELTFGKLPFNGIWVLLVFSIIVTVAAVALIKVTEASQIGLAFQIASGFMIGSAFVHYYLDAYMWRMRDEHNRKTLLPYLKPLQ